MSGCVPQAAAGKLPAVPTTNVHDARRCLCDAAQQAQHDNAPRLFYIPSAFQAQRAHHQAFRTAISPRPHGLRAYHIPSSRQNARHRRRQRPLQLLCQFPIFSRNMLRSRGQRGAFKLIHALFVVLMLIVALQVHLIEFDDNSDEVRLPCTRLSPALTL